MTLRAILVTGSLLAVLPALAADPVRIGVTTILSGPLADRGQSEQYGVELALSRINEAGGVLGRPVEAFYGDNAADIPTGIKATKRLIEEEHVPVLLGALATPVTHAIIPITQAAKVPLVIDISRRARISSTPRASAATTTRSRQSPLIATLRSA
jgi:branched-chain amino acid transport system substrate-binding protein